MLVHLLDAKNARAVARSGLRGQPFTVYAPSGEVELDRAVFAMPVLPNFYASHQWLRELKRRGIRTISAAYFRLRTDAMVWVGRYNKEHRRVPLGHAAGLIMHAPDPRGWQIVISSDVPAKALHAIREAQQIVGWRYFPDSNGRRPWSCTCEYCMESLNKGEFKSAKRRRELIAKAKAERAAEALVAAAEAD